jgi:hypothetical protein
MLEFQFQKIDLTQEQLDEKAKGSGSKFMGPGVYDVEIKSAKWTGPAKDETWQKLEVVLGDATGKEIKTTVLVPTARVEYVTAETKNPYFVFKKFQEFVQALGVLVKLDAKELNKVLPKLFGDVNKLVKKQVKITVAYQKPHVARNSEGKFYIAKADGTRLQIQGLADEVVFEDRDSAVAEGLNFGLNLTKIFPNVVTIAPVAALETEDDEF